MTFIYQIHVNVVTEEKERVNREQAYKRFKVVNELNKEFIIILWIPLSLTTILLMVQVFRILCKSNARNSKNKEKS